MRDSEVGKKESLKQLDVTTFFVNVLGNKISARLPCNRVRRGKAFKFGILSKDLSLKGFQRNLGVSRIDSFP